MKKELSVFLILAATLTGCHSVSTASNSSISSDAVTPAASVVESHVSAPVTEGPITNSNQNASNASSSQSKDSHSSAQTGASTEAAPAASHFRTDSQKEKIHEKVYGAADYAGTSDEIKDYFVDYISSSDWFGATCVDVPYQTEWSIDVGDNGYVTLYVRVWDTGTQYYGDEDPANSYELSTIFFNGSTVVDGLRSAHTNASSSVSGANGDNSGSNPYRESIQAKVYAAADYVNVSDEIKEKFVDFICDSDWFASNCINVPYRTEWSFITGDNGCITLAVNVWDTDTVIGESMDEQSILVNTIYYDGTRVVDGLRSALSK